MGWDSKGITAATASGARRSVSSFAFAYGIRNMVLDIWTRGQLNAPLRFWRSWAAWGHLEGYGRVWRCS